MAAETVPHGERPRALLPAERTPASERSHPVHRLMGSVLEALRETADVSLFGLSAEEVAEATLEAQVAGSMLAGLGLKLVAQADRVDVGASNDSTSTAAWLRSRLPLT